MRYAELHCTSNFSFHRGASHPDELVARAHSLGYEAVAITDQATLAGIVRGHAAAKQAGIKFIIGVEIEPVDAAPVVLWVIDRAGYANLCRLLTRGYENAARQRRGADVPAGACRLSRDDIAIHAEIGRAHV